MTSCGKVQGPPAPCHLRAIVSPQRAPQKPGFNPDYNQDECHIYLQVGPSHGLTLHVAGCCYYVAGIIIRYTQRRCLLSRRTLCACAEHLDPERIVTASRLTTNESLTFMDSDGYLLISLCKSPCVSIAVLRTVLTCDLCVMHA